MVSESVEVEESVIFPKSQKLSPENLTLTWKHDISHPLWNKVNSYETGLKQHLFHTDLKYFGDWMTQRGEPLVLTIEKIPGFVMASATLPSVLQVDSSQFSVSSPGLLPTILSVHLITWSYKNTFGSPKNTPEGLRSASSLQIWYETHTKSRFWR